MEYKLIGGRLRGKVVDIDEDQTRIEVFSQDLSAAHVPDSCRTEIYFKTEWTFSNGKEQKLVHVFVHEDICNDYDIFRELCDGYIDETQNIIKPVELN